MTNYLEPCPHMHNSPIPITCLILSLQPIVIHSYGKYSTFQINIKKNLLTCDYNPHYIRLRNAQNKEKMKKHLRKIFLNAGYTCMFKKKL